MTSPEDFRTCNECNQKSHVVFVIDQWAVKDGKHYCMDCCKILKIGWYEPNTHIISEI